MATLGDVYSRNHSVLSGSLDSAYNQIMGSIDGKTGTHLSGSHTQLQTDLNTLLYGQDDNVARNAARKAYQESMEKATSHIQSDIAELLSQFDFSTWTTPGKINDQMLPDTEGIKRMRVSTLLKAKQDIEDACRTLNNSSQKASDVQEKLNIVYKKLNQATEVLKSVGEDQYFTITKDANKFKEALTIYRELSAFNKLIQRLPSSKEIGDAFENFLGDTVNLRDKWVEEIKKGVAAEAFAKVTGGDTIRRGEILTFTITQDQKEKFKKIPNMRVSKKASDESGLTFSVTFDAGTAKQMKMDVQMADYTKLKESINNPFRISAKNWKTSSGDLGETAILSAIQRINGQGIVDTYALSLLTYDDTLATAHKLAQLSLAADIAMGLSQNGGYADTLVVNIRSGKPRIVVLDMKSIIKAIVEKADKSFVAYLKTYDGAALAKSAQDIINRIPGDTISNEHTQMFLTNMYGVLAAHKVALMLSLSGVGVGNS